MKVSETLTNMAGLAGLPVKDDKKVKPGKRGEFRHQLKMAEDVGYEQYLKDLVDEITRQGERLAERVDIRELKIYKKLIAEFLDLAVGKASCRYQGTDTGSVHMIRSRSKSGYRGIIWPMACFQVRPTIMLSRSKEWISKA